MEKIRMAKDKEIKSSKEIKLYRHKTPHGSMSGWKMHPDNDLTDKEGDMIRESMAYNEEICGGGIGRFWAVDKNADRLVFQFWAEPTKDTMPITQDLVNNNYRHTLVPKIDNYQINELPIRMQSIVLKMAMRGLSHISCEQEYWTYEK
jgi:hypothetical protein